MFAGGFLLRVERLTPSLVKVWDVIEVDMVVVEVLPTGGDVLEKGLMDVRGSLALVKVGGIGSRGQRVVGFFF